MKYFSIYKFHFGLKLGVEECIQKITLNNEEILKKLSEININVDDEIKLEESLNNIINYCF